MPLSIYSFQKRQIFPVNLAKKRRLFFYRILASLFFINFWSASLLPSFAQSYLFDAQIITPENGLANITATSIFKDRQGLIWIGTAYGLNRYDGYNFKLFTKEKNALQYDQDLVQIQEDTDGKLWLFYRGGYYIVPTPYAIRSLDIFDPVTERAVPLDSLFSRDLPFQVNEICLPRILDPHNRLWIHTKKGALFLHEKSRFKKIFQQEGAFFSYITIDQQENIWLGWDNHLMAIDTLGNVLEKVELPNLIIGVFSGPDQSIWTPVMDTVSQKISIWQKSKTGELSLLELQHDGQSVKSNPKPPFLYLHQKGFWFVRIDKQIQVFDLQGRWLFNYNSILGKNIDVGFVNCIEEGTRLWLASPTGVLKASVRENPFQLIHHKENIFSDCRSITEDEHGNIYFLNSQILQWNKKTQQCRELSDPIFAYALLYSDSTVWASTYGGGTPMGFALDLRTQKVTGYPPLRPNKYLTLTLTKTDDPKKFLVGMHPGIAYLDLRQQKALPYNEGRIESANDSLLESSVVNFIYKNRTGYWLATDNGIFLLKKGRRSTLHFDKSGGDLPFNYIRHIFEDKDGLFWLATKGGGIIRWQPPSIDKLEKRSQKPAVRYRQFTTEDGLSDNFTYAVYEDNYGKLWIPSDKGLMRMDKTSFNLQTFTTADGLPHNEFNFTAHYQAKDGMLYFGGLGGLIALDPKSFIEDDAFSAPMAFIGCYVLEGNTDKLTDQTKQLRESNTIRINPGDKFLELHFALLDYEEAGQHRYAYQIEGYSDNWNYIDENFIRITHLPYGNYTLRIRGRNNSRGWSEQELSLPVFVVRPFYLRWWFIALTGLLLLGATLAAVQWRIMELKKGKTRLEAEVRKRTFQLEEQYRQSETDKQTIAAQAVALQELNKAKTRFFSNITHEFRTPLTLIIGPLEQLLEKKESLPVRQKLFGVFKNAKQLLSLINQMLDLSKLEGGHMRVEMARGDIVSYTHELMQRFQPLVEKKAQKLYFNCDFDDWKTQFDKNTWNKIIYNLVSNAIKFTPDEGEIEVRLDKVKREEHEFIQLTVKDTGIGMDKEEMNRIFDRFYQVDASSTRVQGGTGIGLSLVKELVELQEGSISVKSEPGIGTAFIIELPVAKEKSPTQNTDLADEEILLPVLEKQFTSSAHTEANFSQTPLSNTENEKLTLLLIEDNDEMRAYIRQCLDETKYQILEAADGQHGIDQALTHVPDLVISDVMMPQKNGFEVVQTIRDNLITSHIPIILLTAKASLESRLQGLKRGADAYLSKPFNPQELALRIQKLIEIRQILQARYAGAFNHQAPEDGQFEIEDKFIADLKKFIVENLDVVELNEISICKHFGVSRMSLYRKLKALTNQGISDFIRSVRLEVAYKLIQEGRLNLSEITYETGFSSLSHFSRTFKKVFGKSPSDLKAQ